MIAYICPWIIITLHKINHSAQRAMSSWSGLVPSIITLYTFQSDHHFFLRGLYLIPETVFILHWKYTPVKGRAITRSPVCVHACLRKGSECYVEHSPRGGRWRWCYVATWMDWNPCYQESGLGFRAKFCVPKYKFPIVIIQFLLDNKDR